MKNLFFALFGLSLFLFACDIGESTINDPEVISVPQPTIVKSPAFDADSAYTYIEAQVDFGARVPNTEEHEQCAEWLIGFLQKTADTVYTQKANLQAFDGTILKSTNIIASFNPSARKRILLAAHWDTRPFADQDSEDVMVPILGANDGASGVGVLLELSNVLKNNPVGVGVDLILFDSEDYGQPAFSDLPYVPDSYCLGSQYWAAQPHVMNYYANFGILLDMVAAPNATFTKEGFSMYFASNYVNDVWGLASAIGYGSYFSNEQTDEITDDHLYVNTIAQIPMLDIIEYDATTKYGFGEYWHTHDDNMDAIDKATLKAVGQTVTQVVYQFDANEL